MSEIHVCELIDCLKFKECNIEPNQCLARQYYFDMSESLQPTLSVRIECNRNQPSSETGVIISSVM